ncbi:MAG: zinc-ribbon domain-containing protein [bacterium]
MRKSFICNAPLTPDTVSCGSTKKVHWICSARGRHFMAMVRNRTRPGSGCPCCDTHRPPMLRLV